MRQFLFYNLARLGILVVVAAIIIGIFKWSLISAVAAIIISALLSYLLLGRLRDDMNEKVANKVEERRDRKQAEREAGGGGAKGEWAAATKRDQKHRGKDELVEDAELDAKSSDATDDSTRGENPKDE